MRPEGELLVFSGSASPNLTRAICARLGVSVAHGEVIRFSEGTLFVRIGENVRGRDVFLVQSTVFPANDHFMEALFWIDALKRASATSVDRPAVADYPAGRGPDGQGRISPKWFKLGFPSGYMADVLQNLEALSSVGRAGDPRLVRAVEFVLSRQDAAGRWRNGHAHRGKRGCHSTRGTSPASG